MKAKHYLGNCRVCFYILLKVDRKLLYWSNTAGLHSLMPNSLSALAGSLKHLVLSNNKLEAVPTYALRQLRELDHINLNQNNISVIKGGAFWGLSKVKGKLMTPRPKSLPAGHQTDSL